MIGSISDRRSTLCSFLSKGYCRDGNKCNFLHPGVNGPLMEENNSVNGFNSRRKTSPPGHSNNERWRSPPTNTNSNSRDSFSNHHQSSPTITTSSSSSGLPSSTKEHLHQDDAGPASLTPETDTPSSPVDNDNFVAPPKVIPTFTEEDWG